MIHNNDTKLLNLEKDFDGLLDMAQTDWLECVDNTIRFLAEKAYDGSPSSKLPRPAQPIQRPTTTFCTLKSLSHLARIDECDPCFF